MSDFKIPDIKGPRCSKKTTKVHCIKFYNNFRKKYPEYKDLTNKELNQILVTFNETLWETVIDYRDGVKLPESIGWLIIASYKKVKKNIDYKKSIEFNKLILNKNWDTDGKVGKIYFTVQSLKYKIYNREFWAFTGCRNFKRTLAKKICRQPYYVYRWYTFIHKR